MKKGDVVLILLVVLLSLASMKFITASNTSLINKNAVVMVKGEIVKEISMNIKSSGTYEFVFEESVGYVEVEDGRIRMLKMDEEICPQQICSNTGWIEYKYQTIVCLPNEISVNIQGTTNEDSEIDGLSF